MASFDSPSPSSLVFPAHGHPYAIKTTSTAVLSRSNSLSGRSPIPPTLYSSSPNAKPLGRSQSRGHHHRHTRSLSNASAPPQPLPLPPRRRDSQGAEQLEVPPTPNEGAIAQLPDNPKAWTPSQLSTYLSSALRFKGGGSLPAPVAKDIAAFTLRERLGGRAFLRLSEENLVSMGVNKLWREAMLSASRTLRKKVLKGRIWGFGSDKLEDDTPTKHEKRRIPSTVEEVEQESTSPNPSPRTSYRMGRVRGMIESLERSGSSASGSENGDADQSLTMEERVENELKAAGIWINDEPSDDEDNHSQSEDLSLSSASSDNEMVLEDFHSRDSSNGSQPPAYSQNGPNATTQEPTIEDLLAQDASFESTASDYLPPGRGDSYREAPSWGAMMWEKNADIAGGTAKKIIEPIIAPPRPIKPGVIHGGEQTTIYNLFGQQPVMEPVDANVVSVAPTEAPAKVSGLLVREQEAQAFALIEAFKLRLDHMEKRLKELEERDAERERELVLLKAKEHAAVSATEAQDKETSTVPVAEPPMTKEASNFPVASQDDVVPAKDHATTTDMKEDTNQTAHGGLQTMFDHDVPAKSSTSQQLRRRTPHEVDHTHDDPPLEEFSDPEASDLPTYVLFVGLGVAAVILRVLFRRMAGGRRG
ncbi:hypothetical protein CPB86DRAFT_764237 [Serendipita vermifera]|nr:hypothetical protein CPB86DRAFT_764237 [Serendipita vermifera]